jgi:thiol:disulfide interchange protein DsbD
MRALLALWCAVPALAQVSHVAWTVTPESVSDGKALLRAAGKVEPGWHLYSASTPGGMPTSFQIGPETAVSGVRIFQPAPKKAFDQNFGTDTETYEGDVAFLIEVGLKGAAPASLEIKARYQTCTDTQCVPSRYAGTVSLAGAPTTAIAIPAGFSQAKAPAPVTGAAAPGAQPEQGILAFLAVAFGFGLAAIFTPCVFPMIPITMSYFLNRTSGGRRDSVVQAVVFCLGIIVLFTGLGLLMTALLGPFGVVQLGSNPWVNAFIATLFIVFGLSLLGAFEITIPSSILTKLNASSEKGGFAGTLLMGLTFSLASFACVGPFVGTLLAASVSGGGSRPLIGMATFAAGLSLPFFFLALFPSYLKRLPRSGGWMARVKVVMGFVILAASLKYLASLDQVLRWNLLTRERFLAAWIVLFSMAGLYLLGFVRLEGVKPEDRMGVGRLLTGMALLIFAISLFPGMSGARLGDLDAFVPLADSSAPGAASSNALNWMKDQYREALARARVEGKRVFVNFTGYTCANCHWMKANILARPEIASVLQGFVLVELYGDGNDAVSDENQKLQLAKFNTVAVPFYAILDPDEKVIATFDRLTKDPVEFLAFAQKGAGPAAAPAGAQPGHKLTTLEGKPVELSGKVAVVNFWATWCVPCIKEIPSFNKLHRELAGKGVAVVGVAMDEDGIERVKPFLEKHPMDYMVALGNEALAKEYKTEDGLPITIVYDRAGKELKQFRGYLSEPELLAAVQSAL